MIHMACFQSFLGTPKWMVKNHGKPLLIHGCFGGKKFPLFSEETSIKTPYLKTCENKYLVAPRICGKNLSVEAPTDASTKGERPREAPEEI